MCDNSELYSRDAEQMQERAISTQKRLHPNESCTLNMAYGFISSISATKQEKF